MTATGVTEGRLRGPRGVLALLLILGAGRLPDRLARRGVDLAVRVAPPEADAGAGATVIEFPRQRRGSGSASRQPVA